MFRFRTRDQDRRRHYQIKTPEFLVARDVLHRLTAQTALESFVVAAQFSATEFQFRMSIQICLISPENVHHQHLGIQTNVPAPSGSEALRALLDCEIEPQGPLLDRYRFVLELLRLEVRDEAVDERLQFAVHYLG